jgi:glycosyltransferase involved in cell wall biosynthesis
MPHIRHLGKKISCILLTYNHVHTVEEAVKSVLKQKLKGFEFIISDDCSNDGTWEKLLNIKKKYKNIILTKTKKNIGMPGNTNYAFSLCSRPYVALLHHDDLYPSNLLEEWGKMLEKYSEAAFVFNPYKNYENKTISTFLPSEILNGDLLIRNSLLAKLDCSIRGTCMIRKVAFDRIGGMNIKFGYIADIDLWIRLAKRYSVCFAKKTIISVKTQRPKYYSKDYLPLEKFWKKKKLLYNLFSENIEEYKNSSLIKNKLLFYRYLFNVNKDIFYWIIFLLYKKKKNIVLEVKAVIKRKEVFFITRIFIFLIIKILKE